MCYVLIELYSKVIRSYFNISRVVAIFLPETLVAGKPFLMVSKQRYTYISSSTRHRSLSFECKTALEWYFIGPEGSHLEQFFWQYLSS